MRVIDLSMFGLSAPLASLKIQDLLSMLLKRVGDSQRQVRKVSSLQRILFPFIVNFVWYS